MSAERVPHPEKLYTVEEFFDIIPDGQKADLIDGVIHVASPDSIINDDLTDFIRHLMKGFARARSLGKVQGNRVAFVLGPRRSPEPDVAFISTARLGILTPTRVLGAPDIAVEITSKESRQRDYEDKKSLYETAGVREYWLVDPARRNCFFYRLRDGRYELVLLDAGHVFRSEALSGFWLDTGWLFADPLPDPTECLRQIFAGPPPQPS